MSINLGIDIGAVALKLAVVASENESPFLERLCRSRAGFRLAAQPSPRLAVSEYRRISGNPIEASYRLLEAVHEAIPEERIQGWHRERRRRDEVKSPG